MTQKKFNIGINSIMERANSSTNKNKKQIWKNNHRARKERSCYQLEKKNIIITFLTINIPTNRLSSWHKVSLKQL